MLVFSFLRPDRTSLFGLPVFTPSSALCPSQTLLLMLVVVFFFQYKCVFIRVCYDLLKAAECSNRVGR